MAIRSLSQFLSPVPEVVDIIHSAGFTGIGTGPGQLAPPPIPAQGGTWGLALKESAAANDVVFGYTPPPPPPAGIGDWLKVAGMVLGFLTPMGALGSLAEIQSMANRQDALDNKRQEDSFLLPLNLQPRRSPVAFSDGDSGFSFDGFFGGINQALQGGLGQSILNLGTQAASGFIQQQFAPQPVSYGGMAMPAMAAVPAISGAGRAVATVGRGFFNRFPNLATALQSLRNRGANVSRSSMYSALRRFGPEMLVSGGILTAAAVSELAVAGPGRRRMNPGNVKALRKAHRRMKSFHKVCVENDRLVKHRRK